MAEDLAPAYRLISKFKAGYFQGRKSVTKKQQELVRLLSNDLGVPAEGHEFGDLVLLIAQADSYWNKQTQQCSAEYYALFEQGHIAEANAVRTQFSVQCPSAWYRGIIDAL
jgi:hypothetical protein